MLVYDANTSSGKFWHFLLDFSVILEKFDGLGKKLENKGNKLRKIFRSGKFSAAENFPLTTLV